MPDGLQRHDLTFPQLYEQARDSVPLLQREGNEMLADLRSKYPGVFDTAHFETGPLKTEERAKAKIEGDYAGDHSKIADLARGRLVIDKPEQVEALRDYFQQQQRSGFKVEVMKDRFAVPSDTNFRDLNMQARLSNGHVVEFRVEHEDIMQAAKKTHDPYEDIQKIERRAKAEGRMMTEAEALQRQAILDGVRDTHGDPAREAGMDRLLNEKGRAKMTAQEMERVTQRAANDPIYNKGDVIKIAAENPVTAEGVHVPQRSGLTAGRVGAGLVAGLAISATAAAQEAARPGSTGGSIADSALDGALPGWISARRGETCRAFGEATGAIASGTAAVIAAVPITTAAVGVTAVSGPAAPVVGVAAAVGATAAVGAVAAGTNAVVTPAAEAACDGAVQVVQKVKSFFSP